MGCWEQVVSHVVRLLLALSKGRARALFGLTHHLTRLLCCSAASKAVTQSSENVVTGCEGCSCSC